VDYNAVKSIRLRYLRDSRTESDGGIPVSVRLNSGTLNVNSEYSPADDSARARFHGESSTPLVIGWLTPIL